VALRPDAGGLTDGQLLERFLSRRDEAAFEALVYRHGAMVLSVCQRVLRHLQDAEDAFQATFLVLARKAASLRARELLGNWLYGVAYRTAMKARTMNARRRAREDRARVRRTPEAPKDGAWEELLPLLDQELSRLPDKYRVPVVLCDLQGRTRREVAAQLKVPEGTLSGRLTTARKMLARRLARSGLALSGGALAAVLSERAGSACVTRALAASTARVAVLVAAGEALTAGAVPARVVALAEGVIKTMLLTKLRAFVAVAVVAFVSAGVVGLAYRTTAAEPEKTAGAPAAEPGKAAGAPAAGGAPEAAADDLEALRLEVEALRKSLQATRERVRALEDEVAALKGTKAGAGSGPEKSEAAKLKDAAKLKERLDREIRRHRPENPAADRKAREAADSLAEAEAALKQLRQNPNNKQAADALERALQRLKERPKPEGDSPKKP
jgi:RNA polymerase sigma-70 factor (ECF subfamily)